LPVCSFAKNDIRSATLLEELPIKIHNSDIIKVWLQDAVAKQGAVAATSFDRLDLATNAYLVCFTSSSSSSWTVMSGV
jgi:translation initiation factor 3 subunit H